MGINLDEATLRQIVRSVIEQMGGAQGAQQCRCGGAAPAIVHSTPMNGIFPDAKSAAEAAFDGYKQLTVGGKTSVSDIRATIGEALGDKLPEIDKISGSNDWSTFGWVYKTGDTYALLKAADVIDAEKLSAVDGVVTLYGCVKSNWIGPY